MLVLHWKLDFIDGSFLLVEAPSLERSRLISAYYREFRTQLTCIQNLLFKSSSGLDAIAVDMATYPHLVNYYEAIAQRLTPPIASADLTPLSRYRFFINTEPVAHPDYPVPIPGLSGLEQLLGLSHPVKSDADNEKIVITSGDVEIDLMADLLLVFKNQALLLSKQYSMQFLSKLVVQASERSRGSEAIEERQKERDRLAYDKHEQAIAAEFKSRGVVMPFF